MAQIEYFPDIKKIKYDTNAPIDQTMSFRHYNATEVIMGKSMEDWLRFSVCFWHTMRGTGMDPFGQQTIFRKWDDGTESIQNYKRRAEAAFEFFSKLGVKYWTFHDRDIAPEGASLEEANKNLDEIVDHIEKLQKTRGMNLLWATSNLFNNKRYMHGAATSSDAHTTVYAGAQVKKCLEIAKRLNAQNFVFWGGREGYQSLLNTNLRAELDHMAQFFKMVVEYKNKIGFKGQLLIEPKPKEPMKHQYDYDAQTVMSFLHQYKLTPHFKLNIEPNHTTLAGHSYEHDVAMASAFGMLGSIDANTGSPDLGWDTDQFPMSVKDATMVMKIVIEQGGLNPGGLNFDAKVRRESTNDKDLFIAHIGAMDCFARGLKNAAHIIQDGILKKALQDRYESWSSDIGKQIEDNECSLEDCERYIMKNGNPNPVSGCQEHFESILNNYL